MPSDGKLGRMKDLPDRVKLVAKHLHPFRCQTGYRVLVIHLHGVAKRHGGDDSVLVFRSKPVRDYAGEHRSALAVPSDDDIRVGALVHVLADLGARAGDLARPAQLIVDAKVVLQRCGVLYALDGNLVRA